MASSKHEYVLANAAPSAEMKRLRDIDAYMGPTTEHRIARLGIGAGWRCLEVGAGAGGVARWMAAQVGPSGLVTAADIAPLIEPDPALPQLGVRRHNMLDEGLEPAFYDLVHCRLVLVNVGKVELALDRMLQALRPGGWLIVEEPGDTHPPAVSESDPRVAEVNRLTEEFVATFQSRTSAVELGLDEPLLTRGGSTVCLWGQRPS